MDLTLDRRPLYLTESLLDASAEQPVECDALLPDFCPDIARILRCEMTPAVHLQKASGNAVTAEGLARLAVLYVSPDGEAARAEYKVPFSHSFEARGDLSSAVANVEATPGYCNCRAVNSRRLDIRGSVNLAARAESPREETAIAGGSGQGLQMKAERIPAVRLVGRGDREVRLEETQDLPEGLPPALSILRCSGAARADECRVLPGKAMVKGALEVSLLCRAESGWQRTVLSLPLSAAVELPGLSEDCRCRTQARVLSLSAEPVAGADGQNRQVALEASVAVSVTAWQDCAADVCTDCYSTQHPCAFHTAGVDLTAGCRLVSEAVPFQESFPMPDGAEEIIDLWCEPISCALRDAEDGVIAEIRLAVCMLAEGGGELRYFDRYAAAEKALPADCAGMEPEIAVGETSFSAAADGGLEVRCALTLRGTACVRRRETIIDEVTLDDAKPKEGAAAPGLYIYMRADGESLWDIAKKYNTDAGRIAEENDDRASGPLLIPVLQ